VFEIQSRTVLANDFEGACSDCLEISNYFFRVPKEIFKRKMVLGYSKIIIDFLIIDISYANYKANFIITSLYNYFISNRVHLDECDKEENL
jgi:hypothetical protein